MRGSIAVISLSLCLLLAGTCLAREPKPALPGSVIKDLPLRTIKLPPGFEISVYAMVPGARSMCWGKDHTLFVGTREGRIYAVTSLDRKKGHLVYTLADRLNMPNGLLNNRPPAPEVVQSAPFNDSAFWMKLIELDSKAVQSLT